MARLLLPQNYCIEDCNYLLDYYRTRRSPAHLWRRRGLWRAGSGGHRAADHPQDAEDLPQLAGVKVEYTWTGNFLLTLSRLPQFGRIGPNIYYMQGYSGHGVTCTHLAGKLLPRCWSGQAERFDAFAKLPSLPFPGVCSVSPSPPPAPPGTPCAIGWGYDAHRRRWRYGVLAAEG